MRNLEELNLVLLTKEEEKNTEGGAPIAGAWAIAAACGIGLGGLLLGAVVAYGICWGLNKLVSK